MGDSILSMIFLKRDAYTGELRLSKTKTFSILIFILVFLTYISYNMSYYGDLIFEDFVYAFIYGIFTAVISLFIGFLVSHFIDNSEQKLKMREELIEENASDVGSQDVKAEQKVVSNQPAAIDSHLDEHVKPKITADSTPKEKIDVTSQVNNIGQNYSISEVQEDYDLVKSQGDNAVPTILSYLKNHSDQNGYFAGKTMLVKLLGDIGTEKAYEAASEILFTSSRCTGWYDDVVAESATVIGNSGDKKWIPTLNKALDEYFAPVAKISAAIENLSGKKVEHPNVVLDDAMSNMSGLDAIEYLYSLDISNFDDDQKAYYYYILAVKSKGVPSLALTDLPTTFYAAQVYYNSDKNVLGWHELGEEPSEENARKLHEKYPIPESFEEVKNWGTKTDEPVEEEPVEEEPVEEEPVEKLSDSQVSDYLVKISNTGEPLVFGEEYEYQKEYDLLKGQGDSIVPKIENYLRSFARNLGPSIGCDTWYYGGHYLVRLLGDIGTENSLNVVAGLFSIESNSAEWYWNILKEAAIVLGDTGDKKWIPTLNNALNHSMAPVNEISAAIEKLSGEKSQNPKSILHEAEIKINRNDGKVLETIEDLYSIDISDWDDDSVQYYYYLLGNACEKDEDLKNADLPKAFYSAQVFTYPASTSLGWHKLGETPSEENARILHEKYPIPESFEDLKELIGGNDSNNEMDSISNDSSAAENEGADYTSSFKKYI